MSILPPEEHARRLAALRDNPDAPMAYVARLLGIAPTSLVNWVHSRGGREAAMTWEPPTVEEVSVSRSEAHDAAFWRKRAQEAERSLGEMQRLIEELGGIRAVPVTVPTWARAEGGEKRAAVLGLHTSDLHMGEVVRRVEVDGINAYDPKIAAQRMERLFQAACEIGTRWAADTECRGVFLTLGGDLVSGDIHDELRQTNALTAHEQVRAAVEVYCAGITLLLSAYPSVHVVAVPGNHGRTTIKSHAKRYAALSYDILAGAMVADRWRHEPRVTFQIAEGPDVRTAILGREVLVTHGDKLGSGGGMGFAGPALPIVRGTAKARAAQAAVAHAPDLILSGHYHTSMNLPGVLANGSVVGYGEFARSIRAAPESPRQWLFLMRQNWGLSERLDVQLDRLGRPGTAEHVFGRV